MSERGANDVNPTASSRVRYEVLKHIQISTISERKVQLLHTQVLFRSNKMPMQHGVT